jgi:hypothetical protein
MATDKRVTGNVLTFEFIRISDFANGDPDKKQTAENRSHKIPCSLINSRFITLIDNIFAPIREKISAAQKAAGSRNKTSGRNQ